MSSSTRTVGTTFTTIVLPESLALGAIVVDGTLVEIGDGVVDEEGVEVVVEVDDESDVVVVVDVVDVVGTAGGTVVVEALI